MAQRRSQPTRDQIVDAALALAERDGWEAVRLHQVASECGVGLDPVRAHFREKDELIDAWFDRADAAMLRLHDSGTLADQSVRERIRALILAWLDALAPHHRVTREMVGHKLEFGHIHVQFPAVLRISRTVQWLREGAHLDAPLPRRALEETALTALFVQVFLCWLRDRPPEFPATPRWLDRGLGVLDAAAGLVPRGRSPGAATADSEPGPPADDSETAAGPAAGAH